MKLRKSEQQNTQVAANSFTSKCLIMDFFKSKCNTMEILSSFLLVQLLERVSKTLPFTLICPVDK